MYLSIIIPAYNEDKRLSGTLRRIYDFMKSKDYDFEVIVVDDGSIDRTVSIAENSLLAKEGRLRVVKNGINRGKGFSVKSGILDSSGAHVLFTDADLSTPIEEADKLFVSIREGCDIAIGSRGPGSDVKLRQPWYREAMGRVFNLFVKSILFREFSDTQCGFKLFKGAVARDIASRLKIDGFAFDAEMLYIALKKGYKIMEVPVVWVNSLHSKVNPLYEPMKMFRDLFLIRIKHWREI